MKLYATVIDSHGKREGRGDNEYLEVLLNERNENRFLIAFDGEKILVLNYGNGERITLEYAKGEKQKGITMCEYGRIDEPHKANFKNDYGRWVCEKHA